jgi:chemotaxis protein CheX
MSLSNALLETFNTTEEDLFNALKRDVSEIFITMVGLEDLMHLPVQIDPVTEFKDCISSMVGLGGKYSGLISLHMPSELAEKTTCQMLGLRTVSQEDVRDAMGEIANMIGGSFKSHISQTSLDVHLSIPSVVYGKEYVISLCNNPNQIAVRFATEDEWFMVAVAFEEN